MRGQNVERIVKRFYKKINRNTSRHCSAFDNIESLIHNSLVNSACAKEFARHLGIVFCSLPLALRQNAGASKCKQKMIKKTEIHWLQKLSFEVFWRDLGANTRIHYFSILKWNLFAQEVGLAFRFFRPKKGDKSRSLVLCRSSWGSPLRSYLKSFFKITANWRISRSEPLNFIII